MATIIKLPSGNWRAQVRKSGHRPIGKTFPKKAEARAWAEAMEGNRANIDAFPDAEARRRTVADAIDGYMLDYKGRDRVQVSRLSWWKAAYGEQPLAAFTSARVREGLRKLAGESARQGAGRGKNKGKTKALPRKRAGATVVRYQAALSVVMRWAVDEGWITKNPVHGVRRAKQAAGRVRWLSDDERKSLFAAADASAWPDLGLLVRLALSTGARQGELLTLRWEDIDLKAGLATLGRTKNDEPRVLPLVEPVRKTLESKARPIKGGLLFPSPRDPNKPFAFRKHWDAAVTSAKLSNFRFHDLRHSCASYLAMNGASPLEIGDVLGHKTLAMVRRYSHLSTAHKKKLTDRVLSGMVE